MKIAITGASGFLGNSLVHRLHDANHQLRCLRRESSDISRLADIIGIEWVIGDLGDANSAKELVSGCDALVHAAIWRPGRGFQGAEGDIVTFAQKNVVGSLQLFQAAVDAKVDRVVYVSSCAVHDEILPDRKLDETHPLIAKSHYGAHKAAVEAFVHSFARTDSLNICAVRPTGIYGLDKPVENSKWYSLVSQVARSKDVVCNSGGKEVHVDDVAKAIEVLLNSQNVSGQAYACYDRYISQYEVAEIARHLSGSSSKIGGKKTEPKNQIDNSKIKALGVTFGGEERLRQTVKELLEGL
jgi:nucleoside-diphosphate-sugar epimerase